MDYETKLSEYKLNSLISRAKLYALVYLKLNQQIEYQHVRNVISILFEEIGNELFKKGKFVIDNFGSLTLKRMKPRNFYNYQTKQLQKSKGNNIVRFQLFNKLRLIILSNLDIARTFEDDNNE